MLSQSVDNSGTQYESVDDLEEALCASLDNITIDTLQTLVQSMPRCLLAMVEGYGERFRTSERITLYSQYICFSVLAK